LYAKGRSIQLDRKSGKLGRFYVGKTENGCGGISLFSHGQITLYKKFKSG
jgi:hypothetical protein